MVWHVHNVHVLASQRERNRDVMPPQCFFLGLIELLEVGRQRTEFVKVSLGAYQQVLILHIDSRKIPHEIPNIGANAEFVDFTDIDRNAHKRRDIIMRVC